MLSRQNKDAKEIGTDSKLRVTYSDTALSTSNSYVLYVTLRFSQDNSTIRDVIHQLMIQPVKRNHPDQLLIILKLNIISTKVTVVGLLKSLQGLKN